MTQPRKSARFIGRPKWGHGDVRIYELDPPMPSDEDPTVTFHYVAVSAVDAYSGPETYIFACGIDGEVTDWGELEGSFRGSLDHERALAGAGYEVES